MAEDGEENVFANWYYNGGSGKEAQRSPTGAADGATAIAAVKAEAGGGALSGSAVGSQPGDGEGSEEEEELYGEKGTKGIGAAHSRTSSSALALCAQPRVFVASDRLLDERR